jgi:hypothetical protein
MTVMVAGRRCAAILLLLPVLAVAQPAEPASRLVWPTIRAVLFDPTTYVPAAVSYDAKLQDWRTSQALFAHGWVETNPRFTASGRPNDLPLSYAQGKRLIWSDTMSVFQASIVNNLGASAVERILIRRFPGRRRLIGIASFAERVGFAVWLTRRNAAAHYRQAERNRQLAREFGFARP